MGTKSKANQARLANLSKRNLRSQKATVEDASDSDDSDWIPMPEMDEISDSEAEDSDDKNDENTPREPRGEKYLFHVVDYDSGDESDLEEEGTEGDDEAEIENEAALLNFSAALGKAQEIATASARSKEQGAKRPKHYTCNSKRSERRHKRTRKDLVAAGQPLIESWCTELRKVVPDEPLSETEVTELSPLTTVSNINSTLISIR
jgi:hypothetical protein